MNLSKITTAMMVLSPLLANPAAAQEHDNPLPAAGGKFLIYTNKPAADGVITKSPELSLSVGGNAAVSAVMDTGSTGIVIAEDAVSDASQLVSEGADSITYSSSGKIMSGWRARGRVTIAGENGQAVTTDDIPMLVVTKVSCVKNARHCQEGQSTRGIAMIGIGFGREGSNGSSAFTPERNPFLHVADQDGRLRNGYVVTTTGVQVGVTPEQVAGSDFVLTHLQPDQDHPTDWLPQKVAMTLTGHDLETGTVLIDTGVSDMYLTLPYAASLEKTIDACKNQRTGQIAYGQNDCARLQQDVRRASDYTAWTSLKPGTALAIGILSANHADTLSASYSFAMGDDSAAAPDRVLLVGNLAAPTPGVDEKASFVNTSVKFLNDFDYLFDGQDGLTGFHQHLAAPVSRAASE